MTKKLINEICGVFFCALSLFLLWSLLTYSAADSSFYTSHPNVAIQNGAGIIGSFLAHYLYFILGYSAYIFPGMCIFWAVSFFMERMPEKSFFKFLGFLIFQTSTATLFSLIAAAETTQFSMGGLWGFVLSSSLEKYFGFGGGLIISLACFCLSFILATEFLIFPYLSKAFLVLLEMVMNMWVKFKDSLLAKKAPDFTSPSTSAKKNTKKAQPRKSKAKKIVEEEAEEEEEYEEEEEEEDEEEGEVEEEEEEYEEEEDDEEYEDEAEEEAPVDVPEVKVKKYDPRLLEEEKMKEEKLKQAKNKDAVAVFSANAADADGAPVYQKPPYDLLMKPETVAIDDDLTENQRILETCLREFGIEVRVTEIEQGPVITRYELLPAPGVKVSRISALQDDLALALKAPTIRIIAPIPGKAAVGIEVPNSTTNVVYLRELLQSAPATKKAKIPLVFGKEINGKPLVADLAEMPHLLIAGATGSGKTVCINTIITSFFYCLSPDQLRLVMIDPKMVELACYNGVPHMLAPVVTNPKKAAATLNWVVQEMENRYKLFAKVGVRNIQSYNSRKIEEPEESNDDSSLEEEMMDEDAMAVEKDPVSLPYIVVIVDELADLMLIAADKVETAIARLAQLSRATGIHLILATQRPSVDVITGVIKANFPARVSFKVSSMTDSRTVLDFKGAEKLLGKGDMLFLKPGQAKPIRAQGTLINDSEINAIVDFLKNHGEPEYNESIQEASSGNTQQVDMEKDERYDECVEVVLSSNQASVSILQRRLRIGYTRAARIIDMMEADGIIGPYQGSKPREVLVSRSRNKGD